MRLPNGAWVVVADGERRLLLENHGDDELIDLRVRDHAEHPTQPDSQVGSERPGRFPGPGPRREAVQETDWRRLEKARFAGELADLLNDAARAGTLPPFVLMADPRTLGEIRDHLRAAARDQMLKDLPADRTHDEIPEIEAAIGRL